MRNPIRPPLALVLGATLIVAACSTGAASSSPSQPASASSVPSASAAASAAPSGAAPASPDEAAELVIASDPRFLGFGPLNPDAIGQCCWYESTRTTDGYQVLIHAGWGDCPSGCIEEHRWRYTVDRAGRISLRDESGEPVPAGVRPPAVEGDGRLRIKLVAGPTCPVETIPPQPDCDPAKVADAIVVVRDSQGRVVAEPASDQEGTIILTLPAGAYVLEPSVVEDYLGQAEPVIVWVLPGTPAAVTLAYDTGIR